MKMLLTSNGLANSAITEALGELVGKPFALASAAFVPTAANLHDGDKSWLIDDLYKFRQLGLGKLDIVDLASRPGHSTMERLTDADIVVFGGGDPYHLLDCAENAGLKDGIISLFDTRTYVGISGGSQAAGPHPSLASECSLFGELGGGEDPWRAGFGLTDIYFRPHLDSPNFPCAQLDVFREVGRKLPGPAYAVDDESALVVENGRVRAVGTGRTVLAERP